MPRYGLTAKKVKQLIGAEGSFTLEKLETFKSRWDDGLKENGNGDFVLDTNVRAKFIAKYVRATTEPFMTARFGEGIIDELFPKYRNKVAELLEEVILEHAYLVMFMTKK
ncbi:Anthranilate O-methyltransferase 1 isoform C [Glycine soja]|uniref:Anthranilate O-methyltransferase 1 isoform A n=2 Tax=Glycine soja TaxID=3848 RepID=A0A445K310_GLYSO|nr:hypothetical protein JHK86_014075 [Glycine max]RZC05208.1 Anthranilate O-methyltransferase 1 isoform A [Glycine soja]RZC05209.1 Anthranilate O-methyltransferase 1 isoform B [Glycine soja]RZC05210.1 Anthranilate O-methyltransferase 1 isoform C [Glycine soja]